MKRERLITLDVLRAIAGLTVPMFHICEQFSRDPAGRMSFYCGHGYLAVEFFLILMGYMLGFAYDRRWNEGMGMGGFFRRRLIRLHPLVISGVLLGVGVALVQSFTGANLMPWFKGESTGNLIALSLWAMTMVPVFASTMLNPFNPCSWTLYYEYAANILYALFVRRLNQKWLLALTLIAGAWWLSYVFHWNLNDLFHTHLQVLNDVAGRKAFSTVTGWATSNTHYYGAFARLMLPFLLGLLLSRTGWKIRLNKTLAFWISLILFVVILYAPDSYELGKPNHLWINGVFELVSVTVVFPFLLLIGVGAGTSAETRTSRVWAFLAELSYPLYMSHYMFIAMLGIWVHEHAAEHSVPMLIGVQVAVYAAFILLAMAIMHWWDKPVQAFLNRLGKENKQ